MNIEFCYRYRDAGNYKQNGIEIFSNDNNLSLEEIENAIRSSLIEEGWFYAKKWQLKDLHYYPFDQELDHDWHEYDCIEETENAATMGDISDFLTLIESARESSIVTRLMNGANATEA